jgi:hypothetical protein
MLNWAVIFTDFWHLCVAFGLGGAIGWNREYEEHNTGVRAFPIVAMASCTFVTIASYGGDVAAQSRVLQGLVAGIGHSGERAERGGDWRSGGDGPFWRGGEPDRSEPGGAARAHADQEQVGPDTGQAGSLSGKGTFYRETKRLLKAIFYRL